MERDHSRSNTREKFPPIKPGRTCLAANGDVKRVPSYSKQYIMNPCPPSSEPTKRPRPRSGSSSTSIEEIKRQRAGSDHSLHPTVVFEEIRRLSPSGDRRVLSTEIKYQKSKDVQYLSPTVIDEINRQNSRGDHTVTEASEFSMPDPDCGRCATPFTETIKRQKCNTAHALNTLNVIPEEQRPERENSVERMNISPEVPFIPTLAEALATASYVDASVTADFDTKAAHSTSRMEFLQNQAQCVDDTLKSISAQMFRNVHSPSDLYANSSDIATNRAPTPVVSDPKAERKRRKREKKEREMRKMEEERRKEQEKVEEAKRKEEEKLAQEKLVAEISRNRSMFNGNRDLLPAIGAKAPEVNFYMGKLPEIKENVLSATPMPENNVVDVIRKYDTQVRTTAFLREIGQDYLNASANLMEPLRKNEAVDIIDRHEDQHGRSYTTSYTMRRSQGGYEKPSTPTSRCSSGMSRWGPQ